MKVLNMSVSLHMFLQKNKSNHSGVKKSCVHSSKIIDAIYFQAESDIYNINTPTKC